MAKNNTYPDGIKPETKEFSKRKEIKKLLGKLVKQIAEDETYKSFKSLGFDKKEGNYFVYSGEGEKKGGMGTAEGKVNVTISYPKKYSDSEDSAPLISNMQKITTFGGKKLVSEIYMDIKGDTLEITYKNTEDSAFHSSKLEKKSTITDISKKEKLKSNLEKFFKDITKAEAEYLTGTKISQDDKIEKNQNASTVMENKFMENKFNITLKELFESDYKELGNKIYNLVKESEEKELDDKIKVKTNKGEKELLRGEEEIEDKVNEITTTPGGIASAFGGDINPTDSQTTSAGGSFPTLAGNPIKRDLKSPKGQDGEVVADEDNLPKNYRVNENVEKTPYGQMHQKRGRIEKSSDGTYSVKVDMEPGYLNVPKGMKQNYALGMHGKGEVNSKEELNNTGHGELSQLDEGYNKKIKLCKKKFTTNEENQSKGVNKRYIVTEKLNESEKKKRYKQLIETELFDDIKDEYDYIPGESYDDYANRKFEAENTNDNIESELSSTCACGEEEGFEIVPKTKTSLIMFKLSESDLKENKVYIKDHFTNKIVLNPRYEQKPIVNENTSVIDNIQKLYNKYGSSYPYATDAIAYYIFGDKSDDNILTKSYKGVYGKNSQVDSNDVSEYMMNNEYSWQENIEDIDNFIKNLSTSDGGILSDYF